MRTKVNSWLRFSTSFACLIVLLCGCGGDPYRSDYVKTAAEVRPADLVGTYMPTAETAAKIKNEGHYPAAKTFITLSQDKTFQASSIPDWWQLDYDQPKGMFDNGSGKWSVVDAQSGAIVSLDFTSLKGVRTTRRFKSGSLLGQIYIIGRKPPYLKPPYLKPPYLLHTTIGDADNGDAMQFQKVSPTKTSTTR